MDLGCSHGREFGCAVGFADRAHLANRVSGSVHHPNSAAWPLPILARVKFLITKSRGAGVNQSPIGGAEILSTNCEGMPNRSAVF